MMKYNTAFEASSTLPGLPYLDTEGLNILYS